MGGAANQGVGRVGQRVEHILADELTSFGVYERLEKAVDHLGVHGSFGI